jgi:ABC-2 type transport system ATP-binding protein
MIEVQGLTKYYGRTRAISDVSFGVRKGEILGFLGPNGAGKTTTLRILTGFLPPTSGTARIADLDVFEDSLEVRRLIGYLPETVPLYTDMTVRSYLIFMARLRGLSADGWAKRTRHVVERCGLGDVRDRLIGHLSKGYRQRVGIAQALIHNPPVVILDEPTIGLDPKQVVEVRQLIKSLAGEHTVVLSSHILPEVSQVCERIVIIHRGRTVAEDTPEGLTAQLRKAETIRVKIRNRGAEVRRALQELPGVIAVNPDGRDDADGAGYYIESRMGSDVREDVARLIVNKGWGLLEMAPVPMTLEEIFLELTTDEKGVRAR